MENKINVYAHSVHVKKKKINSQIYTTSILVIIVYPIPSALIVTCSNTRDFTLLPPFFSPPPFTARHRLFSRPNFNLARNEAKLISPTASELIRKIRLPVVFRSNRFATR